MEITPCSDHETIVFAASELSEYTRRILGVEPEIATPGSSGGDLLVGTTQKIPDADSPEVENPWIDDAIDVSVDEDGRGFVCGNTPRACLQAVYRYLREQGCWWLRPGPDGEMIPSLPELSPVEIRERPSYRHRGVHLGGNVDEADIRAYVDWIPKVGYNAVIIEHLEGETFQKGRDRRMDLPMEASGPLPEYRASELHEFAVGEIEKRGLVYHAVGHNWTGAAIGMADAPRDPDTDRVPEEYREYLAKVDGTRELYGSGTQDTELCYSNERARERFVEAVREYAASHPEIDVLHVWLSDGHNNHCECGGCRGTRPADYYVELLNGIDDALSAEGLDHRIAFLAYTDLLWPPVEERIENEDRFVLMFAPIRRDYVDGYEDGGPAELPAYERNELEFPVDISENVAFLEAWFDRFDGDSFVFDYHFWRTHLLTPGAVEFARFLARDMRALEEVGLDGSVSCNVHRAFFPTGLGMGLAGAILWDRTTSIEEFVEAYLEASFGSDHRAVREFYDSLSELSDEEYVRKRERPEQASVADRSREMAETIRSFRPVVDRNRGRDRNAETGGRNAGTHATSWEHLAFHVDLWEGLAEALRFRARGEEELAHARWEACKDAATGRAGELADAFDFWQFEAAFDSLFAVDR